MPIRNIVFGRYCQILRYKVVRIRLSISKCLGIVCSIIAMWILYVAFLQDYSNFGLGEWAIRRPRANQACVHPQMPLNNPNMLQYLRKIPPVECPDGQDWIYTDQGRVYISPDAVARHGSITCKMIPIFMTDDDFAPSKGSDQPLVNGSLLKHDAFIAKCGAANGKLYDSIHHGIKRRDDVINKKIQVKENGFKGLNVVIWGTDSMSSLMFQRLLPKLHEYFTKTLGAVLLESYNIIGDGTAQAWIPILTGKTQFEQPDVQKGVPDASFCDIYPLIWKEFEKRGYLTSFAEDDPNFAMFHYKLKGFKEQPTHHYMRPFYIEAAKYIAPVFLPFDNRPSKYCLGSRPLPRLMLDWIKELFLTYPDTPKFSISFNAALTHEYNNNAQLQEPFLLDFLHYMNSKSYLNNTVMVLMSDHGARYHKMRATEQGKLEERMPYFAVYFPEWFRNIYPREYKNFVQNSQRLTTPFDIHETLMELLGIVPMKSTNNPGPGISLFSEVPLERTCSQAHIEPHYCACLKWAKVSTDDRDVVSAVQSVLKTLNDLLKPFSSDCMPLTMGSIKGASRFSTNEDVLRFQESPSGGSDQPDMSDDMQAQDILFLVIFYSEPNNALFEATTRKRTSDGKFLVDLKQISRINKYGNSSWCIKQKATHLLPYCVCKSPVQNV